MPRHLSKLTKLFQNYALETPQNENDASSPFESHKIVPKFKLPLTINNMAQQNYSDKIKRTIKFWGDPKTNQQFLYNICTKDNEKFRKKLGNFYIGPTNFVCISNKAKKNFIHFTSDENSFNFELSSLIIPGIKATEIKTSEEFDKIEIPVFKFVYKENDVFFHTFDIDKGLCFSKRILKEEPPRKKMKNLNKKKN